MAWLLCRAFWQTPLVFLLFGLVSGSLFMVNILELPFARSLVSCSAPPAGNFTGSRHCGDRLEVIGQGQRFSSRAQSLEHCARLVGLFTTAAFADRFGRRVVLVGGATCVLASILLFSLAAAHRAWSVPLFVLAQGLQGAVDFELLGSIVCSDLAGVPGADEQSIFTVMNIVSGIAQGVGGSLGVHFQVHEILDFGPAWRGLLFAGCFILAATLLSRETMPPRARAEAGVPRGLLEGVREELQDYRGMLREQPLVRAVCLRGLFMGLASTRSLDSSLIMGIHGFSQKETIVCMVPLYPWGMLWSGLAPSFIGLLGERQALGAAKVSLQVLMMACIPLFSVSHRSVFILLYSLGVIGGLLGLENTLKHRLVPEEHRAKAKALWSLTEAVVSPVPLCLYAQLFDAKATGYLGRGLPYLVSAAFHCLGFCVFWTRLWPAFADDADRLRAEREELERQHGGKGPPGRTWRVCCVFFLVTVLTRNAVIGLLVATVAWHYTRTWLVICVFFMVSFVTRYGVVGLLAAALTWWRTRAQGLEVQAKER